MIGTRTEGAAALAAVWIDIDPAGIEAPADDPAVVFSQGPDRLQDHLLRLLIGVVPAAAAGQGCIEVIVVELIQAQDLPAQLGIAVHGGQVGADRPDQGVVNLRRNILSGHGHSPGALVAAHLCLRRRSLDGTCVSGRKGVDMLTVALIKAAEGILPQGPVRAGLQQDEIGTCQLMFLSLRVFDGIKDQVRVLQIVGDLAGRREDLAEAGQQSLLLLRQGMRLLPQQFFHHKMIGRQHL